MPRQIGEMDDLINGKIRKRGCSSSASSSSSIIQNYRLKKAVLVGKRGGSSTPVPTWRLRNSRSPSVALRAVDSPQHAGSQSGRSKVQAPVSARKLAATLWEMNEIPSPRMKDGLMERRLKKESRGREKIPRSTHLGPLPPHLSDPSHSPVSERTDRSGTGSHRRRTPSISHRLRSTEPSGRVSGSLSNASLMEIETRSRAQTPRGSTAGVKPRLKDVSNALTTSKELLKIINRIWGHEDRPSSNMSLISALHAELERARLLVNQLIQEHRSDENEINYLMKCFAEEKAAWKSKERKGVEAAMEPVVGELEVERKLRRRFESLNKKLGRELADAKACLLKAVKELESEKRAREIMEQVCDELAGDIGVGEERTQDLKIEPEAVKACEEVEKEREREREREMMKLAEVLQEERSQMKLSEAKYQVQEKNSAIDSLRKQLEAFLGTKRGKGKGNGLSSYQDDEEAADYFTRSRRGTHYGEEGKEDAGEVVDGLESAEGSVDSELHSIELDIDNSKRSRSKSAHPRRDVLNEEIRARKSTSGKASRKSALQRSTSDGVEWVQNQRLSDPRYELDWERVGERGYLDEMNRYKSDKGVRDRLLSGPSIVSPRAFASPVRQWEQMRSSREPSHERPPMVPSSAGRSRLGSEVVSRKARR
ncbi:uncharacterized protein At5g41620 [Punica granatum]|uniref:Uncharacterized protein At5g41620 n=2 Tax=Punica granatum TaxID=22663 RepID=A0A6P8CAL1_PUNGR|nr:uncharacterized protein At5g41620 [Punica granatum]XP_031380862.1 uncharacterized protein At5g41620 [Punica granatum]OWM79057.1 hypothetical protein CDL15_Pgr003228 [Punica granatum]PKI49371.1 hypothetical protein CRG98_030299 [Punica granatum]